MVKLFRTQIKQLEKINYNIRNNLSMTGTQIILGKVNIAKKDEVTELIQKAIAILETVE